MTSTLPAQPSTAPVAMVNLVNTIGLQPAAQSVDSQYQFGLTIGEPYGGWEVADGIYIPKVERNAQIFQMVSGPVFGWLREDYVLPFECFTYRGGDDYLTVHQRIWGLVNAVEQAVRADPTLGNVVVEAVPESSPVTYGWNETGRVATATVNVKCFAVI